MKILPNTIIYFHEINDQTSFINNINFLLKNYNLIGLKDLEDYYYNNKNLKNSCHITFDDGDITFYNNVFPIIKKYNIPVSLYVSPKIALEGVNFWFQEIRGYNTNGLIKNFEKVTNIKIDKSKDIDIKKYLKTLSIDKIHEIIKAYQNDTNTPPKVNINMSAKQLVELQDSGLVEIGAHTINHPLLTNESDEVAKYEIHESINQLSNILDKQVRYFVYPNGNYSDREISILKEKDIKLAFTTDRGKMSLQNNPLSIPRSGSPLVSELYKNKTYAYSKCLLQLMVGENLYYRYSNIWSSMFVK